MAHVGVLKVLCGAGIPIDYISGTSIGAWVGAYYAKTKDVQQLEQTTLGYKKEKLRALLEPTLKKGGVIKGDRLESLLIQLLGNPLFSSLEIPLTVVATSIKTGDEIHYSKGYVVQALRASTAIPLMFAPVKYRGDLLVDGGLSNPLSTDVVKSMGADIVIAINLDGYLRRATQDKQDPKSLRHAAATSFDLVRYHLAEKNARLADVVIEPHFKVQTFKTWKGYFLENKEMEFMKAGERAAQEALPKIKKLLR